MNNAFLWPTLFLLGLTSVYGQLDLNEHMTSSSSAHDQHESGSNTDFSSDAHGRDYCANETDIIDHILYDTTVHYNRHKTPADPVTVRIELWIQEVTSVSEMTQDFEIG